MHARTKKQETRHRRESFYVECSVSYLYKAISKSSLIIRDTKQINYDY